LQLKITWWHLQLADKAN